MIESGNVVFIKTTGEAVYVIQISGTGMTAEHLKSEAMVRRPVMGQNGITHVSETFYTTELQTLDEQRAQFRAEREELYGKVGAGVSQATEQKFLA